MDLEIIDEFNLLTGLIAGIVFFLSTGLTTGLIPNPLYVRMVPITLLDYFFLLTTSVLAAVYFGQEKCSTLDKRFAALGGVTGFLAFGCPVCNIVLLALLSSSTILAYIEPLRPFLGLISTIFLAVIIIRDGS
ncbi:MAG: hypothetical protein H8Z69_04865 [Nanohaloarchaea archaeon]|nr:hypothetical protein [Candidatus Nanohaloarchaea archaeon]